MIRRTFAVLGLSLTLTAVSALPTIIATSSAATAKPVHLTAFEHRLLALMNHDRRVRGMRPLTIAPCAEDFARQWTRTMAATDLLRHNPLFGSLGSATYCRRASMMAENIGLSTTGADALYVAYMHSPKHRANILNPGLVYVGIGSWKRADGAVFDTLDFANGSSPRYVSVKRLGQGLSTP